MPDITIVVAGDPGPALERTMAAYRQESAGIEIAFLNWPTGEGADSAWSRGAEHATGAYIHFTSDDFEPHPGWWQAAAAAVKARLIPQPVLWLPNGVCTIGKHDWETATGSSLPFLSRAQLAQAGPPHADKAWPALPSAVRTQYAFTWHTWQPADSTLSVDIPNIDISTLSVDKTTMKETP